MPNLNKLLADRRASVPLPEIGKTVRTEIEAVFSARKGIERVFFPEKPNQVPDRAVLTLVVLAPENDTADPATAMLMETMAKEHGSASRTYKSALLWCVAEKANLLSEEARKVLAWEDIDNDADNLKLDESQHRQLAENLKRAKRDLREAVWRSYKNIFLLDEKNALRKIDLGLVHSSAADSLVSLILGRLQQEDLVSEGVSPSFLVRNWPPALPEWSTKAVRDVFFASPKFPRLLNTDTVKQIICRGVEAGLLAYMSKKPDGTYDSFVFREGMRETDVEVADDVYLIKSEEAGAYLESQKTGASTPTQPAIQPLSPTASGTGVTYPIGGSAVGGGATSKPTQDTSIPEVVPGFRWTGEITSQKWMNFYTKVLARFAAIKGMKLTLTVEVNPEEGVSKSKIEEVKTALRELGMSENVEVREDSA